jgi:hypothetical protein
VSRGLSHSINVSTAKLKAERILRRSVTRYCCAGLP